ncbi:DUF554 domain-containing protein [Thermotoga sp. Ku-13t]|uniref:DUF554 domain-containing protein n=1 Tax=Thermotoga sp. Ku-13t TaxID=1755813 RepID=UPI002407BF9C|nr:DUF554 domain-containing protein [Thermotoga sp. Ku-13t]
MLINAVCVFVGSSIGMALGKAVSERFKKILFQAVGLTTIGVGIKMTLDTANFIIVLLSLAFGAILGEMIDIEEKLSRVGRFSKDSTRFAKGFVAATTLFLVGPMTIVGSIRAGLLNDGTLIYVKSVLDFISSVVLASLYGVGVFVTGVVVLIVQGSMVLLASQLSFLTQQSYLANFTGVGGLIVLAIGLRLLELKDIKVGNFLPALVLSPLIDFIARFFK